MNLDQKQKDLVHKLLGMLGSDFDGERAVAAKKISDMAKAQKASIPDLMRHCYAIIQAYRPPPPPPPPPPRQEKRSGAWYTKNEIDADDLLTALYDLFDEVGEEPLTEWEINFVRDIRSRGLYSLSEKQEAVVNRIMAKLARYEKSNF